MRKELLAQERAKRRKQKHGEAQKKNDTIAVYNQIIGEMGDSYYKGYSTSEDDEDDLHPSEVVHSKVKGGGSGSEEEEEEKEVVDEVPDKLDKEEIAQMMLEDAIQPRKYILSARSTYRFVWDVIIIIFAIINAVTLPLDIAFEDFMNELSFIQALDTFTTFLFFMDILFGFFTSYINVASGDEIYGMRMIALNYVCGGTFLIDILSTFPLDDWVSGIGDPNLTNFFKIFGFLKM